MQDYIIFLDEEVIPSADFLNFFRQCFEAITTDKTLSGISAWNPYGMCKQISCHYDYLAKISAPVPVVCIIKCFSKYGVILVIKRKNL